MGARRRAGQAQGGELIAVTMAAALIFFVGREALRTSRETAEQTTRLTPVRSDSASSSAPAAPPAATIAVLPTRVDSAALQPADTRLDPAELRRRIEVGAPGTYVGDMLRDRDSLLIRWPERTMEPVRVWIQRKGTFTGWTPELFGLARGAFDDWGQVSLPIRFTFVVDSGQAEIRVNFADKLPDGSRLGVTTNRHDQNGWIAGADIVVATHDTAGTPLSPALIAAIARHEVGHALGLAHSKDRATIMYAESQTLTITAADRATLRLLYTLPAGSVK